MGNKSFDFRELTKALLIGVSVGTVTLATAGCVPEKASFRRTDVPESELYAQAVRTLDPSLINSYLATYPGSFRIPSLLDRLPPATLAAVSPSVVAGLNPEVRVMLSPRVRQAFPTTTSYSSYSNSPNDGPRDSRRSSSSVS